MSREAEKQSLREFVGARVEAIVRRDSDALAASLHPDLREFNVLPPIELDAAAVNEQTAAWFEGYADGPQYEVHNLQVDVDGDLGYCAFLYHVSGTLQSGDEVSMWVRATLVCRRVDGRWLVIDEQDSIPWDPKSGQGVLDAAPTNT